MVVKRDFSLMYANLAAIRFLGRPISEVVDFSSFFPTLDKVSFAHSFSSIFSTASSFSFSVRDRRTVFNLQLSPLLNPMGQVEAAFSVFLEQSPPPDSLDPFSSKLLAWVSQVESAREQDKAKISRAIHDELGQALTCISMDVSFLSKHLEQISQETRVRFESLGQQIKETIQTVRRISSSLRPSVLDDFGLPAAIEWLASEFESHNKISCHVETSGEFLFDTDFSTFIFRLCEEVLSDISLRVDVKHISFRLTHSANVLGLSIHDDGREMQLEDSVDALPEKFSLGDRISLLGGSLEMICDPLFGMTRIFRFPYPAK